MKKKLRIITRESNLALEQVKEVIRHFSDIDFEIISRRSYGDKHKEVSLMPDVPGDFFTRELDRMLLDGEGDAAVHSAKDLSVPLTAGLSLIALLKADDRSDCLVSRNNLTLKNLLKGARVGASFEARKKQLLGLRPDLKIIPVRGTIEERLALVDNGRIDALVVAACALKRLGLESRISEILP
ncbi:MAG: hydroxymethylbilane synthase, partial [Elusimicrobiota bacterium]